MAMENCPTCGSVFVQQCRCMLAHRECKNGHGWHVCPTHHLTVAAKSDHGSGLACTCHLGPTFHPNGQKYHPVQPRTSSGSWTLPTGEHHPLNGGDITVSATDHYVDVKFTKTKTLDMGENSEPIKLTEHVAQASGYRSANDKTLVMLNVQVAPTGRKKGIGSAMLAELGTAAKQEGWKYSTTNLLADEGAKFVKGLVRRGLASEREDFKGAYWLDADKLAAKYPREASKS